MRKHHVSLFVLAFSVSLVGCGSGGGGTPVSGKVTFSDGSPLTKGTVFFEGQTTSASGEIGPDGSYSLGTAEPGDGAPPGEYRVYLGGEAAGGGYESSAPLVASKYLIPSESGLTKTVGNDAVTFDIKVEKPEGQPSQ